MIVDGGVLRRSPGLLFNNRHSVKVLIDELTDVYRNWDELRSLEGR